MGHGRDARRHRAVLDGGRDAARGELRRHVVARAGAATRRAGPRGLGAHLPGRRRADGHPRHRRSPDRRRDGAAGDEGRAVPSRRAGAAGESARRRDQDRARDDVAASHGADRRRPHRLRGLRRRDRRRRLHASEALPRSLPAGVRGARRRARTTPSRSRTRRTACAPRSPPVRRSIGVPLMVSIAGAGAHAVWPTLEGRTAGGRRAVPRRSRADAGRTRARGETR